MADNSNAEQDQELKKEGKDELQVVETDMDISIDIAATVFSPSERDLNLDFKSSENSEANSTTSDGGSGKPATNYNIEFISEGAALHNVKTEPSMAIPEGKLTKQTKDAIKKRAKLSQEKQGLQENENEIEEK